jgi:ribosome biogenesis GTPase
MHKEQVMAANLDTVFITCGMDRDFNLRRLERYLTMIYNCGINPVILLTKADLQEYPEQFVAEVETIGYGVPVYPVSLKDTACLIPIREYLSPGQTVALIGSSGAGKSTLVNRLYGNKIQLTGEVSQSLGKGKHTTTRRQLFQLPGGGMLIDNPGMREISFSDDAGAIDTVFPDIDELSAYCRFPDCSHTHEPGCNIMAAVESGELGKNRLENYLKMKRELDYFSNREKKGSAKAEKDLWQGVALQVKALKKQRR